ncbi:MAG: hypothetical protein HQK81_04255 [Desulfovibrionaceae bacterium]|nr:hypothetical protein [Desulfovibrionaceae bacterium]MBF0513257.1 hypothetical protein [Desulfovibrionaceae bacterium]
MSLSADELKQTLSEHHVAEAERLHEIATEDVSISIEAVAAIKHAAVDILARFMPGDRLGGMSTADIIQLFAEKLFWNEKTGGLLLCSELGDGAYCLPIPKEHWTVSHKGVFH